VNQHPKHVLIVKLLQDNWSDSRIARKLHIGRGPVARIREAEGIGPVVRHTSLADKLTDLTGPAVAGGHMWWLGRRNGVTPVIRHNGRERQAAAVSFEIRTGRKAEGQVRPECGADRCINAWHLSDDIERRRVRLQMRALQGFGPPWSICNHGHEWEEYGRVEPALSLYCKGCTSDRDIRLIRNRKAS
jgi:hypothetical protein